MTIDELERELLEKAFIPPVKPRQGETVTEDVDKFLRVQFIIVELWTKELNNCPAYQRLLRFYEATR